jgi:hypothetical protein
MSWTCPTCGRKFKTERHYHSCEIYSLEDHLKKCKPEIKKLAEDLLREIKSWKNAQVTPLKSMILASGGANFFSLKAKKDHLDVEFILPDERNEFPVYKTMNYSKNKIVHYVKFDSAKELDGQLMGWIREAYEMTQKK